MGLEDYKEIVGSCATICTMGQMLAGTLICKDIYRKGSSKGFDPMPFLGATAMCSLMLQYACIVGDSAMININIFGILTNAIYMAIYYYYTPQTKDTLAVIGKATAFVMVLLAYAQVESPEKIEIRFGLIVTALHLLFVASPFIHLGEIIRTKNTDVLQFPLIFMGTIVSFLWLLYGLMLSDVFIIFQNSVALVLLLAQISLYVIFPSKSKINTTSQVKRD